MRFWQEYRSGQRLPRRFKAWWKHRHRAGTSARMRGELGGNPPWRTGGSATSCALSAGDMIPADIRLIESRDLFISQAVLTARLPVEKYDEPSARSARSPPSGSAADQQDLLELPNICFMGTNVVSGTATAVVVATGARTYFGSLARSIVGSRAQTAFDRRGEQRQLAADPLHAGDGADRAADQRFHQGRLDRGVHVRSRRGGRLTRKCCR